MAKQRNTPHHLIFEGTELTGKSYVISEIYDALEKKYSSQKFPNLLDGCHWFNTDVGVYGSELGGKILDGYLRIAETLKNRNIIFEKFHITDQVYSNLYSRFCPDYRALEKKLSALNFKIIYLEVDPDIEIFKKRLADRLELYPHYDRIAQQPADYLKQQVTYQKFIAGTSLPVLKVNTSKLPNLQIINNILQWLGEL